MVKPSRRALLGSLAAATAAPALAGQASDLDEMIADHRWAKEAAEVAVVAHWELEEKHRLPAPAIEYGRRRIEDPETGAVSYAPMEFRTREQIESHFGRMIAAWESDRLQRTRVGELRVTRDRLISEIGQIEAERCDAEQRLGITAAAEMAERACREAEALRKRVLCYRPTTMAEVAAKNSFLLALLKEGFDFDDELLGIFGSVDANRR
ncbi:hypothetical protein AE618_13135 [Bosea vaviloviae]|uniref:Uncharacterized protein n=2 Tax=Bosea vaviloviae TaxID=1526658 RepID=A0A0N0MBA8_9HYPH|nr:hypothetical protein AE618_13135 [Bosea vaviloviae]